MSKEPLPEEPLPEEPTDLPPSYETATLPSSSSRDYVGRLHEHISSLPAIIRSSQAAHVNNQQSADLNILSHLLPHINSFLAAIAASPSPPSLAELTLVPAAAVPEIWQSSADKTRKEGELKRLVRVADPQQNQTEKQAPASTSEISPRSAERAERTFDEWGLWSDDVRPRTTGPGEWWWRDEGLASRLSALLQPKVEPKLDRQTVHAVVQQSKEERKKPWGFLRGSTQSPPAAPPPVLVKPKTEEDRVVMTVKPEEVAFRKENEFGVWESMSGWGIVVCIKIRRT